MVIKIEILELNFIYFNLIYNTWGTERCTVTFCFASVKSEIPPTPESTLGIPNIKAI